MLSIPKNFKVDIIPFGCCGMTGAFGYDKNNYELSMAIGEQALFPAVRNSDSSTIIAAPGTSCRQQILDATGRKAQHPVQILYEALSKRSKFESDQKREVKTEGGFGIYEVG